MRRLLIIAVLLLPASQYFIAGAQQINIRRYNIEDGLVNNDVHNIYQDSRGFIWLCTRGGLSLYDGSRFTNYTTGNGLTHDMVNDIFEVTPQEFIVAQNADGPRLLKNGRMQPMAGSGSVVVNEFYRFKDDRLIATADYIGAVELKDGKLKQLRPGYAYSIIRIAPLNDSVWFVIDVNFAAQFTGPQLKPRTELMYIGATALITDSRQRTWMGTVRGLKLVDPSIQKGKSVSTLPLPPSFDIPILRHSYIMDMMEDSQGNMWIATTNGLVKVSKNGASEIYTQQNGLPASMVNCILEDRQRNIWIGTPLGVAKLWVNNEVTLFNPEMDVTQEAVYAISPLDKNTLRFFDKKSVQELDLRTGRFSNRTLIDPNGYGMLKPAKGEVMIRRGRRGLVYHAGSEQVDTLNWPDSNFHALIRINKDNFLIANNQWLYSVSGGRSAKLLHIGTRGYVYCFAFDMKNFLWAGTWQEGLVKLQVSSAGDSVQVKIVDTVAARLPDPHIRSVYADKENELWIGTRYKGVTRLRELPNGKYDIQQYGTAQGLSSDFILTINRDPKGNIWVGTAQGIDKLLPAKDGYRVFNFGKVNKIFSKIYSIHFIDSNYFVAAGYPSLVYARDMQQDALPPPPVYITKMAGGPADSSHGIQAANLSLPYDKAQIYFEFSAPDFINEDFTKYSYRLMGGNDTAWNIAGASRSVYFANLRPGNYHFEVRSLGFNGEWGAAARYSFAVNAPFWQRPWFIALVVIALGFLIYLLYRYRVHQLIRLQKVRNRIATDLHDEIGSNLTNISILSNLSKSNLLQPQKAGDFLTRISEEVSSSSQALDDIIWSVNARHDTLEETVARMRRYAAELFDAANIRYELYLDPAFEGRRLTMEQRRDIYLLYKESVNNISKHAAAKNVAIQIAVESNQLLLSVKDDGKGFDAGRESNRYGIKGMKERVKKWKGRIHIESAPGRGTFIRVRLPVSK